MGKYPTTHFFPYFSVFLIPAASYSEFNSQCCGSSQGFSIVGAIRVRAGSSVMVDSGRGHSVSYLLFVWVQPAYLTEPCRNLTDWHET